MSATNKNAFLPRLAEAGCRVVVTVWIGGMWTVGYVVVPALFASLPEDRQLAGRLAGRLFTLHAWLGLACAAYLLVFFGLRWRRLAPRRPVFWVTAAVALLVAASLFGIQPLMAQLKADALPRDVMESVFRDRFVAWHGVSSILYLLQSLLGLWLVVAIRRGSE